MLVRFYCNFKFLCRFSKNIQIPYVMKFSRVVTELFQANVRTSRRTDITKLIVAFRHFAKSD